MIITASNLGKRFNREWIFRGLNAVFSTGNIYAILGPNGSGKSTLLRVLWGQEPQSEGEIYFTQHEKKISIDEVFNHIAIAAPYMELIEELTLLEHLEFHFRLKRKAYPIDNLSILEKIELDHVKHKQIKQFSSGMKQRLKLGLTFYSACEAIFLDEPTTNLDDKAVQWYLRNLAEIRSKKLIFIATNQPEDYPKDSKVFNLNALNMVTNHSG